MIDIIEIKDEYITLGQLLQIKGLIHSGGAAKAFLSEHPIYINGDRDDRRGKKLYNGDIVLIPSVGKIKIVRTLDKKGN